MARKLAVQVLNEEPLMSANQAGDIIPLVGDYVFDGTEATNDIIEMVGLPAGYVPVDMIVDNQDAGTTVTANAGIITGQFNKTTEDDGDPRTCGAEFMSAKALGTASLLRMDVVGSHRIAPVSYDRGIGFALSSVSAPTAGAKVRMTVTARPALNGV